MEQTVSDVDVHSSLLGKRLATVFFMLSLAGLGCADPSEEGDGEPADVLDVESDQRDATRPPDLTPGDGDLADVPTECVGDRDCYDENPCTTDYCNAGICANVPNDSVTPSQITGNCHEEVCEGGILVLNVDDEDVPREDGIECTTAICEYGVPTVVVDHNICRDDDACNGLEYCDPDSGCQEGTSVDYDEDGIADAIDPNPPDADSDGITDCADWETCDGIDNDNNGFVDDDPQDEEIGGECYEGPEGTEGVGTCRSGFLNCERGALRCVEQVLPAEIEYCDGLDNDCDGVVGPEEIEAQCRSNLTLEPDAQGPELLRMEFPIALRLVDVHFNIDTTGSMSGALNQLRDSLRTEIVPAVAQVIPVAAFGVSTFEDFPLYAFGATDDLPFELWQRITTRVDLVQDALAAIYLGSGADMEESGIESLYQLASGAGVRWPIRAGTSPADPADRQGFMAEIDPAGDVDFYQVEADEGSVLGIDIDAFRIGSSLDSYLELFDSAGLLIASNDDTDGLDPAINVILSSVGPYYVKVRGYSTSSAGWYFCEVRVDGMAVLPEENTCTELEVGGEFFIGAGDAVTLRPIEEVIPRPDIDDCVSDCLASLGAPVSAGSWIISFCSGGTSSECGDGEEDPGEECDDGNRISGDGCSASCMLETEGVPAFIAEVGFDPSLGHGTRGGAGFREQALPIIVHATDAPSHDQQDYQEVDPSIGAHETEDVFFELEKLGARIVGITTSSLNGSSVSDPEATPGMAFRTGSLVPTCAFDGSEPRIDGTCEESECCVGIDGAGRAPPGGTDGMCVLSFEMDGYGRGLSDGVVAGINALSRFATYTITPVVQNDSRNPRDARCFLQHIAVNSVVQETQCAPELEYADRDGDGYLETVLNATPRARVTYDFWVENRDSHDVDGDLDAFEPCGPAGNYYLQVEITGDDVTVLARQELSFTVLE